MLRQKKDKDLKKRMKRNKNGSRQKEKSRFEKKKRYKMEWYAINAEMLRSVVVVVDGGLLLQPIV